MKLSFFKFMTMGICLALYGCSLDSPPKLGSSCEDLDIKDIEYIYVDEGSGLVAIDSNMADSDPNYAKYQVYFHSKHFCPDDLKCTNYKLPNTATTTDQTENDSESDQTHAYCIKDCPKGTHEVDSTANDITYTYCEEDDTSNCGTAGYECQSNMWQWQEGACIAGECVPSKCESIPLGSDHFRLPRVSKIKKKCVDKNYCCGKYCANCDAIGQACSNNNECVDRDKCCGPDCINCIKDGKVCSQQGPENTDQVTTVGTCIDP